MISGIDLDEDIVMFLQIEGQRASLRDSKAFNVPMKNHFCRGFLMALYQWKEHRYKIMPLRPLTDH